MGCPLGWHEWSELDRDAVQRRLERLFLTYALGRIVPFKVVRFIAAWGQMREHPARSWGSAWRAYLCLYFTVLISIGTWIARSKRRDPYVPAAVVAALSDWDATLATRSYLTGDRVGFVDFALFGHLQCMCSGLTDELLPGIRRYPSLMRWLSEMHGLQKGSVPMFTKRLWDEDNRDVHIDVVFWATVCVCVAFWPITLCSVGLALWRRSNNGARTGARLRTQR